jgi:electron transport complex protein RnfG
VKNKNDIQAMLKEAGILFAITLIAGLLLGFVYELTKEPIRQQEEKAVQEACQADKKSGITVKSVVVETTFRCIQPL